MATLLTDEQVFGTAPQQGARLLSDAEVFAAEPMTQGDKYLSHPLVRLAKGLKDPIDAGAQMIPRALNILLRRGLPQEYDMGGPTQAVSNWLTGEAKSVDKDIADSEREYTQARAKSAPATISSLVTGKNDPGTDWMRIAGNVLSPANAIPAKAIPIGGFSTLSRAAGTGAVAGAMGGLLQPVTDESADFGATKGMQAGAGAAGGAVLSPIVTKLAQVVIPTVSRFFGSVSPSKLSDADIDVGIRKALDGAKINPRELPAEIFNGLRDQVRQGLATGRNIDIPAAARVSDAKGLGVDLTLGQATRDPMQYAREVNLRGVENVGEPLAIRFQQQGGKLRGTLDDLSGEGNAFQAGEKIKGALAAEDAARQGKADVLYRGFRELAPDVTSQNPQAWASRLMDRLEENMVGGALPADHIARLNKIATGQFPLTPSTLHQMYVSTNAALRGAQGSSKTALGIFKSSLDDEMMALAEANARQAAPPGSMVPFGVTTPEVANSESLRALQSLKLGRKEVAQRYGQQEEVPAIKAALDDVSGEDFVKRFLLNGKTGEVLRMGTILRKNDPEAFSAARSQIGQALQRSAFGENPAGDKIFRPESFAQALRTIGDEKLMAFYTPAEVDTLKQVGRVGAYIYSHPDRAAVNTSNNSAWALSILQKLPFGGATLSLGKAALGAATRDRSVKSALAAEVPAQLSPEIEAEVARLLSPSLVGVGVGAGVPFR